MNIIYIYIYMHNMCLYTRTYMHIHNVLYIYVCECVCVHIICEILRVNEIYTLMTRLPFQYKNSLSKYGNRHYKDDPVVRPSYLYDGNPYMERLFFISKRPRYL